MLIFHLNIKIHLNVNVSPMLMLHINICSQYMSWLVVWCSWNAFVACFYLNVGALDNRQDTLNLGTGSASWWEVSHLKINLQST